MAKMPDLRSSLRSRLAPGFDRCRAVVAAACLVGGCQVANPQWESKPIEASQSVIRFDHADFDPKLAEYVVQRDPRSANTFYAAHFAGADAFALLAALKTGPSHVVEERTTERYVANLLQDAKPDWGEQGEAAARGGPVAYRMFRLPGQSASCVGFRQLVGHSSDDRNRRKDVVFGYFCQSQGRPRSAATAEDLIASVSLTRPRVNAGAPF